MTTMTAMAEVPRSGRTRRRAVRRTVKRIVYGLLGACGLAAMVIAWMPRPLPAEMAVVARGPLRVTVDEDGQARIRDRYVVAAPLAGSLARIVREPGDAIARGDVLARIAPVTPVLLDARARATATARLEQAIAAERQTRAQIERARVTAEYAKVDARRTQVLFDKAVATHHDIEQADLAERRAAHELDAETLAGRVAAYEVAMARTAIERAPGERGGAGQLEVQSPIAGRVLKVLRQSEGVVTPGTPLVEVGDPAALEIAVDVLTSDAARIRVGAPVVIDRWGGATLEGRVRRIEPSAFTRLSALGVEEQRVNVLIDLTSPRAAWATLADGYRVEAHVVVWSGPEVLKVPASALFRRADGGWALFRVDGRVARLTPVAIGQRTAIEVEILEGVSAGDRVIAHPSDRVHDGAKVAEQ